MDSTGARIEGNRSSLENLTMETNNGPKGILKREPIYVTMGGSQLLREDGGNRPAQPQTTRKRTESESDYLEMDKLRSLRPSSGTNVARETVVSSTTTAMVHRIDPSETRSEDVYNRITVLDSEHVSASDFPPPPPNL